ncbi:MAG TPA: electron transfer flavoprotein subunit beta/FixA family protein [Bacillota bacterium]|nr:electron transfer flavoprotein subunit beta/FixA family protein [Bacillota bacterium]
MITLRVVACYKYVLDEQDLRVNPGDRSLSTDRAAWKISDFDRNAIEEAVRIKEKHGAVVFALTAGPAGAKASLKDALARGSDEGFFIQEESLAGADPAVTAKILARAIKKIGSCDLVLCGEGASDDYAQQVGPRVAVHLGWPAVTYAGKILLEGGVLKAERKLDDGTELVELELPAVVTVTGDINVPRIPSIKQLIGAGKKPVQTLTLADLGIEPGRVASSLRSESVKGAVVERKRHIFKGDTVEAVSQLVTALVKEGAI